MHHVQTHQSTSLLLWDCQSVKRPWVDCIRRKTKSSISSPSRSFVFQRDVWWPVRHGNGMQARELMNRHQRVAVIIIRRLPTTHQAAATWCRCYSLYIPLLLLLLLLLLQDVMPSRSENAQQTIDRHPVDRIAAIHHIHVAAIAVGYVTCSLRRRRRCCLINHVISSVRVACFRTRVIRD